MMEVDSKGVEVKRRRDAAALEECEYIVWQWNKKAMITSVLLSNSVYSTGYEVKGKKNKKWQDVADLFEFTRWFGGVWLGR